MKLRNSSQTITLSYSRFDCHAQHCHDPDITYEAIKNEMNFCINPVLLSSDYTLWATVGVLGRSAVVPEGMDPLGARSQFVDIQTLPTWQQQLSEETPSNQSDGPPSPHAFPSPFPFRPDINRKLILM